MSLFKTSKYNKNIAAEISDIFYFTLKKSVLNLVFNDFITLLFYHF